MRESLYIEIKPEYKNLSCVYKITFDDKWFYIGSTRNLKTRLPLFNSMFAGFTGSKPSKYLIGIALCSSKVNIEILESVTDANILLDRENFYLKQHSTKDLILNRSKNAFSNKGIKWTEEENRKRSVSMNGHSVSDKSRQLMSIKLKERYAKLPRTKKERIKKVRVYPPANSKAVIKYDSSGKELAKYPTIAAAASCNNVNETSIKRYVNGIRKPSSGIIFKFA